MPAGTIRIRWMIRRDMPEVMEIEGRSFEFPWAEDDFIRCLRQRNCIGMVAELDERVVGFVIYEHHKSRIYILNLAVHPAFRRLGVGTAAVQKLAGKLSAQRRNRVVLRVRETNLDAQRFFRACGFLATGIDRGHYDDTTEDAYRFEFRCAATAMDCLKDGSGESVS